LSSKASAPGSLCELGAFLLLSVSVSVETFNQIIRKDENSG
jgi:hypothetical protein